MPLKIDVSSGTHIGDREEQQDRVAIIPHKHLPGVALAVVADGMGGHTGGAMAAQQVISTAQQIFANFSSKDDSPQKLLTSIVHESHLIITLSSYTSEAEPHSTVVAMLLQPGRADWAHVGDTRLYHYRKGALVQRTLDHSYVEQLYKEGKITAEERDTHPQKNILIHCLGGENPPLISYGETAELLDGDCFLMCSDGLWAYFPDEEMGKILDEEPPRSASEKLIAAARVRARGRGDNLTLSIIKYAYIEPEKPKVIAPPPNFKWVPPPKPSETEEDDPATVEAKKSGMLGKLFGKK
jgi:PPM family protein phosphatase